MAFSQERSLTYDGLGQPMPAQNLSVTVNGKVTSTVQTTQSLNGREVPVESTEERVVRDDSGVRVVERVVRRYGPNGVAGPAEKTVIEEQKRGDGGSTVKTTTYRADMNGNMMLAERSLAEARKSGDSTIVNQSVERASINGSLELAERRDLLTQKTTTGETRNTTVYRRNENGQLVEAQREIAERTDNKAGSVENVTVYEAVSTGRLTLQGQTVRRTSKAADGSEQVEVDVYKRDVPGLTNSEQNPKPLLAEHQTIARRKQGTNIVETVDIARPSMSDPNRLGEPHRVSQTVCNGKCGAQ